MTQIDFLSFAHLRLASELTPHKLKDEAETIMQNLVTLVQYTAVSNLHSFILLLQSFFQRSLGPLIAIPTYRLRIVIYPSLMANDLHFKLCTYSSSPQN